MQELALFFEIELWFPFVLIVYQFYSGNCLFVTTELQTSSSFSKVRVLTLGINFYGEFEPLKCIQVLFLKKIAAANVIHTAKVVWIDFHTREVVVKSNIVLVLIVILGVPLWFFCLNQHPFTHPEIGTFENVLSDCRFGWLKNFENNSCLFNAVSSCFINLKVVFIGWNCKARASLGFTHDCLLFLWHHKFYLLDWTSLSRLRYRLPSLMLEFHNTRRINRWKVSNLNVESRIFLSVRKT